MKRNSSERRPFNLFRSSRSSSGTRNAPKSRALRLESLEDRRLLSATPYENADELAETPLVGAIASVADSTDPATWVVSLTSDDVSTEGTLRYALANAQAGDSITFAPAMKGQTIVLSGSQLEVSKSITIDASALFDAGSSDPQITVDANQASRVFSIASSVQVEFRGLTITNGKVDGNGGGVYVASSGVTTFVDCVITGNESFCADSKDRFGGGLYFGQYASATFENCVISNNIVRSKGGYSANGGGVYFHGGRGTVTFTNCVVSGNVAQNGDYANGGGVYVNSSSNLNLSFVNSIVLNNEATTNPEIKGAANAYSTLSDYSAWSNASSEGVVNYLYDPDSPLFLDAENGDYRLPEGSQALDLGDNSFVQTDVDIIGNERIYNGIVDLGAYERVKLPSPVLSQVAITDTSITLGIGAVERATRYLLEFSTDENFATSESFVYDAPGEKLFENLTPDTLYHFRVKTTEPAYYDSDLATIAIRTDWPTLADPTFSVVPDVETESTLTVLIGAVAEAQHYVVQYSTKSNFPASSTGTATFDSAGEQTIVGLNCDATYYLRVKATAYRHYDSNWIRARGKTDLGWLAAPTISVDETARTDSSLDVLVGSVDNATNYVLEYGTDQTFAVCETIDVAPGRTTLSDLAANTDYYFRVKAAAVHYYDSETSEASGKTDMATLDAPTFARIAVADSSATVAIGEVEDAAKYVLEYSLDPSFATSAVVVYDLPGQKTVENLTPDALYYFRVKATEPEHYDSAFAELEIQTGWSTLADPTFSVVPSAATDSTLTVLIGEVAEAREYVVEYSFDPSFATSETATFAAGERTISGLNLDSTYYLRVKATAERHYDSNWVSATGATDLGSLETPTLAVDPDATTDASLTVVVGAVENATGYVLEYGTDQTFAVCETLDVTPGRTTLSDLAANTDYYFRLKATAPHYHDSASAETNARTDMAILDAPTLVVVDDLTTDSSITVEVGAVDDATGYVLEYGTDSSFAVCETIDVVPGRTTLSDLAASTGYYFRVKATSADASTDDSPWSETASSTFETPSILVTSLVDAVDPRDGLISLREAIAYAGTSGLGTTIVFDPSLKGGTIRLNGEELTIDRPMTVDASALWDVENDAPGLTIDGQGLSRVFHTLNGTQSAPIQLLGLTIANGSAFDGGGLLSNCELVVRNCAIENCVSTGNGGGFLHDSWDKINLYNVVARNNFAAFNGGGGFANSPIYAENSEFVDNVATYDGGGLYLNYTSTLANCLVLGNETGSDGRGGGICVRGTAQITNATFDDNESPVGADIFAKESGRATLSNAIVAIGAATAASRDSAATLAANNTLSSFADWTSGANNYAYDPNASLFADAANGDYQLVEDSQAIDRGNNVFVETDYDLAGNRRVANGRVDLGVFEYQTEDAPAETPSTIVTTAEDVVNACDGLISLREAIAYAGTGDLGTTITFDASLKGGTIRLNGEELTIDRPVTVDASALWDAENDSPGLTIDGQGFSRVFHTMNGTQSDPIQLLSLTIANGNASQGAGVNNGGGSSGELVMRDCIVKNCVSSGVGGGLYHGSGDKGGLYNVVFENNYSGDRGGGIFSNGQFYAENCRVVGNQSKYDGGGLYLIYNSTVVNCLVANNSTGSNAKGGGIGILGNAEIVGSTIVDNAASLGTSLSTTNYGRINVKNSIVALTEENEVSIGADTTLYAFNTLSSFTGWTGGSNNYVYDPNSSLFVDATNGDYRLALGSQAIDKGNNAHVQSDLDLAGNARIQNGVVDFGAYEYHPNPLSAPTVVATPSQTSVSLSVSEVENATGYVVDYGTDPDFATFETTTSNSRDVTISNLTPGTTYYIRVKAIANDYDDSEWTVASATTLAGSLEAPTLTFNGATTNSVALTIGSVDGATEYVLWRSTSASFASATQIAYSTPGAKTIVGLDPNATYYFRVKATAEGFDDSNWSSTLSAATLDPTAVPLETPTIAALSGTKTAVVVKLVAVEGAQKYVVEYATNANFSNAVSKTYSSAGSKTISGLPTGTWYYVRVKATATGRPDSPYAEVRKVYTGSTYAMPSFTFSAVKTSVVLNIKPGKIDASQGAPEKYVVEYSESPDFSNAKSRTVNQGVNDDGTLKPCKPTISGLTFATKYYFRVKAIGSLGNDSAWNANSGKPIAAGQLAVPTFFTSKVGTDFINVRCYNSAGASGFEVMWSTSSDFSEVQYAQGSASAGIVSITGLDSGTKYYYRVRALGDNVSRVDSTWSVIVNNATTKAAPVSSAVLDSDVENYFEEDELDEFWDVLAKSVAR